MAPDAIEQALRAYDEDPETAAVCGFVVPRTVRTLWERGRYIEYLFAFYFAKQIQDYFARPLISSGCFSIYRTEWLRRVGGWPTRTLAEDMDVTWSLYELGAKVRFIPESVSYPIEPDTGRIMLTQLKRWSHGFIQNVLLHGRNAMKTPFLRVVLAVALWDSIFASIFYVILLPVLAVLVSPWLLIGYVIDLPVILVPVIAAGRARGELGTALLSVPSFLVLRVVNAVSILKAVFLELVLRRRFDTYEKGH
jgi:biofilm PGA synthesis N-glycosyltransferase PgaC